MLAVDLLVLVFASALVMVMALNPCAVILSEAKDLDPEVPYGYEILRFAQDHNNRNNVNRGRLFQFALPLIEPLANITYMMTILFIATISFFLLRFADAQGLRQRERERFSRTRTPSTATQERQRTSDRWFEMIGRFVAQKGNTRDAQKGLGVHRANHLIQKEMTAKLRRAGLETFSEQGKFFFAQLLCYLTWPVICLQAWLHFTRYYSVVATLFSFVIVVLLPHLWLKWKIHLRKEDIHRELPLFVDLLNLATSAGWDIAAALEKVIDALVPEFPKHPLFRELKRARWLAASGYTWEESLTRVAERLRDDSVTRTTRALTIAIAQGGDRSMQLGGIAEDAERNYYAAVDRRLAAVPLQALLITIVLFLMYFTILLAPAAVGVGDVSSFL